MNGEGEGGGGVEEMEEDGREGMVVEVEGEEMKTEREKTLLMWGYLPGVSPQRSPMLHPVAIRMAESAAGDRWKDASGGGCGFAMAISESGKIYTWDSTDDMGQNYVTSGKHEEIPEVFNLPTEVPIIKAAAGWAHCAAVTASPRSQSSRASRTMSGLDSKIADENTKRRRLSSVKVGSERLSFGKKVLSAPPCHVSLGVGVCILTVAAGGRHMLALSDAGQVSGWGYGEEGQLGLGTRIRNVSSPHRVPCLEFASLSKVRSSPASQGKQSSHGESNNKLIGSCVKAIACGGRHSATVTDAGALLTFGWGLYGQKMDRYFAGDGTNMDRSGFIPWPSQYGIRVVDMRMDTSLLPFKSNLQFFFICLLTNCILSTGGIEELDVSNGHNI